MLPRPQVVYLVDAPSTDDEAHLVLTSPERTLCLQAARSHRRQLTLARSKWPAGPRCPRCFRDV